MKYVLCIKVYKGFIDFDNYTGKLKNVIKLCIEFSSNLQILFAQFLDSLVAGKFSLIYFLMGELSR